MKKIYLGLFVLLFSSSIIIAQNFQIISANPISQLASSSLAFADVDNDGDQDFFIIGTKNSIQYSELYINNGSGFYTLATGMPFTGVEFGSVEFADIDNDGDQDVLISGYMSTFPGALTELYRNDGNGGFVLDSNANFPTTISGDNKFADVDNDGDLDLLITGLANTNQIARLFLNDGFGNFSPVTSSFSLVESSSVAFADIDNDGDQDVLITGYNSSLTRTSRLYLNDGNGVFSVVAGTPFDGVDEGSVAFSDVDNDGDQDVLISGSSATGFISKLYKNNGNGNFTLVLGTPFDAVKRGSITFGDVDNDGDQDVLITGLIGGFNSIANLYLNDGTGLYTLLSNYNFAGGIKSGDVKFLDVDNDSDLDILFTGGFGASTGVYENLGFPCSISSNFNYVNNGNGNYTFTNTSTGSFSQSRWAFGDGNISSLTNLNHTFTSNGTFVVVLTINDPSILPTNECFDYQIDTITVTGVVNPAQCTAGFVMYPDTTTGGVTVVNSSTGNNLTYIWDFGDGTPNSSLATPSHSYTTTGPFYLCLTVTDGSCVNMFCDSIGVNGVVFKQAGFTINVIAPPLTTQVNEQVALSSDLNIYPNPTNSELVIEFGDFLLSTTQLSIINVGGKVVYENNTITTNKVFIDSRVWDKGVYLVKITNKQSCQVVKLIKQ